MQAAHTVVVFGSTGTAGFGVLSACLADPRIGEVRSITRRATGVSHPKLREVIVPDLGDLSTATEALTGVDACLYCLGISQSQAKDEADYRHITYDLAMHAATALLKHSPQHTFGFISGASTDPTGKSWMMWARVKGETENALKSLGLKRVFLFRPGYIHPMREQNKKGFGASLARGIFPVARAIARGSVIQADELGRGMIETVLGDGEGRVLENRDILAMAKSGSNERRT